MLLIIHKLSRGFHTSMTAFAVEKSALGTLRKKTGYTFSNCKKALEMHDNDLLKAEGWLRQQAQALGWSKATKLEGRKTTQGLIGVAVDSNEGVMVEINCETDFVARNAEFENMVRDATESCLDYLKSCQNHDVITKIGLGGDQLKFLKARDGKSLADKLALMIGKVGENATLKRALGIKVNTGIQLSSYVHPSGNSIGNIHLGRIGGLIAVRSVDSDNPEIEQIAQGLCQHVVGMAPKIISKPEEMPQPGKEEEPDLVHQNYLLDESLTVKELLELNRVEVIDFERFECGETLTVVREQPLDSVETCQ